MTVPKPSGPHALRQLKWPLFVVALLLISVLAHVFLIAKALHDPGLAVEKDYYRRAIQWDASHANGSAPHRGPVARIAP